MHNTTLSLLKKRLKATQKLIHKTFVAYDSVKELCYLSYFEFYAKDHNYKTDDSVKVVYKNITDDFVADSIKLFSLLGRADLLIQKINKQKINIVTNN